MKFERKVDFFHFWSFFWVQKWPFLGPKTAFLAIFLNFFAFLSLDFFAFLSLDFFAFLTVIMSKVYDKQVLVKI